MVARSESALAALADRLGDATLALAGDVALPDVSRMAVARTLARFGRLDAVVANAGITLGKTVDETLERELDRLLAVNVKALVFIAQAAHAALTRSRGSLLVMASNKGLVAQRGSPVYVATKGAAVQLARALALDWADDGIRVNALCPGLVDTDMLRAYASSTGDHDDALSRLASEQPLGRLADPEECAAAAAFLVSEEARYITGVALPVDGGFVAQ
jgi:meso-butanediol dehydrogenase / (S,S)-butanediol dehydrogenase / diacetyl reductase